MTTMPPESHPEVDTCEQARTALARQTFTAPQSWLQVDGPAVGVWDEYWFVHQDDKRKAYVCIDKGAVTCIDVEQKPVHQLISTQTEAVGQPEPAARRPRP